MAKPTKDALSITIIVGLITLIGVVLGFVFSSPLVALVSMLPLVGYEIYRVEGKSTRWASIGLAGLIVTEIILILFGISYDLAAFLDMDSKYIQGYEVPLGDVKVVAPALMAVLSIVLFKNTRGTYTKTLSVLIFLAAFAVIFMLDSGIFEQFAKIMLDAVLQEA